MKTITKETEPDILSSDSGVILVKFGASWCSPCNALDKVLERVEEDGFEIYTVDVDSEPELTRKHGVRGVPTTITFNNGIDKTSTTGLLTVASIMNLIQESI